MPKKEPRSNAFPITKRNGVRYTLDMPADLAARVKRRAAREGVSLRALILSLLDAWLVQ